MDRAKDHAAVVVSFEGASGLGVEVSFRFSGGIAPQSRSKRSLMSQTGPAWQVRRGNVRASSQYSCCEREQGMRNRIFSTVFFFLLFCVSGLARPVEQDTNSHTLNSCANARQTMPNPLPDRDGEHVAKAPIWQLPNNIFFFTAGMTIDADGAPNAYHPDDTGIDELANAGWQGHWDGIVTDRYGNPLVQQEADPFPGYYISCTSLVDKTKEFNDPSRYVDATKIPYVALPEEIAESGGLQLGDFAFVVNLRNRRSSFAIYADIGSLGEGSVALAERLGISPNARQGGESGGVLYLFFPGSGNRQPRTAEEIQTEGERLLSDSGAIEELSSCSENNDVPVISSGGF